MQAHAKGNSSVFSWRNVHEVSGRYCLMVQLADCMIELGCDSHENTCWASLFCTTPYLPVTRHESGGIAVFSPFKPSVYLAGGDATPCAFFLVLPVPHSWLSTVRRPGRRKPGSTEDSEIKRERMRSGPLGRGDLSLMEMDRETQVEFAASAGS